MSEEKPLGSNEDKEDVKVVIEVSEDKSEVYLTLAPLTEPPGFSTDKIRRALADKGIKFGIDERVIALLEEEVKYKERILIASGMRPTDGKDGTIKYFFESNQKVKKGEKLAEIIPPEPGEDGITVFDKIIPARQVQKAEIPKLINIDFSPENEFLLIAKIEGYLLIDQAYLQIMPLFELEKSADEDEVYVKVVKPVQDGDFSAEDLRRFLNDNEIVDGILEEEIENIFKQKKFEHPVLIAQKVKEEPTEPGEVKKEVRVLVEVSKDELEAHLTLTPLTEAPEYSTDQIRKNLAEKEIKVGILEDLLEQLDKEMKYNERLLIAAGTRPAEGKDGTIKYFFESDQTVKVKKGEKIGEIIPPEKGKDGVTVFGEQIPAPELKKARIPDLINVEFSAENENLLVANIDGYLFIDQSTLTVTPFFELEELSDEYEAHLKVTKPLQEGDFNAENLKRFLDDNGIVYGILEEEIESIFKQDKFGQRILIAQGKKAVHEKDAEIKYHFDTEVKPQMDARGNIDYKELNLIQNVQAGDILAETNPPEPGAEGCTIFGKKIEPKTGAQPPLPLGKNAKPDPKNPNILISEIDGSVKLKGNVIEVLPVIVVKEDVDFTTGNIDFTGSVIVKRDVKSGFKIKARDDVQVEGVVEDAVIEAGGNVLLKTGFVGRGEGQIIAQGEVTAKYCENENITSKGDIHIDECVMHSKIRTKGCLFLMGKAGLIVGGETYAVKGIEAKVIGNENYVPTAVFVGVDQEATENLKVKRAYLAKNAEHLKEIERTLNKFSRRQLVKKPMPEDKKNLSAKLNQIKQEKQSENKVLAAEIEKLKGKIEEFKNAVVKVVNTVYPGTKITIYNRHTTVNEPLKSVYFKYTEEEVVAANLAELG